MWLSVKALREVQIDRALRQKPYLVFDIGGWELNIEFVNAGRSIPGLNPAFVAKKFPNLPENAESVRLINSPDQDGFYGKLLNCGTGPALSTKVTWVAKKVKIGSEEFEINARKRKEPIYDIDLNSMPTVPSFIIPNEQAELTRIPTFIEKDIEKKITSVEGFFKIECVDTSGKSYVFKQEFFIFMDYKGDSSKGMPPRFHVTFGDPIDDIDD